MQKGSFIFKARGLIHFHFCLYLIFFYSIFWDIKSELTWLIAGSLLIITGEIIRIWSAACIGTTGRSFDLDVKKLQTSGPYAYVRNPIYLANFIWITGYAVIAKMFFLIPYFIFLLIILYCNFIPYEEKYLEETFGEEYRQYCKKVNRLIPKFKRYVSNEKAAYDIKKALINEVFILSYQFITIATVFVISFIRSNYKIILK